MKRLRIVIISCTIGLFVSCTDNSAPTTVNSANRAISVAAHPNESQHATFSYHSDGASVSGGEVDETATNNAASVTKSPDNGNKLSFFLSEDVVQKDETFAHSLRFAIPDKTGETKLTPDEDNWSVQLFVSKGDEAKYVLYANESFTVTVTGRSATRVSGTFSGKVKLAESTGTGKPELSITDGKFDIPVRNISN